MATNRRAIVIVLVFGLVPAMAIRADDSPPVFENDILPILAEKCSKCHSAKVRKASLDLSSIDGLRRGGESGESSIADSVDDSMLWIMLDGGDMPPEGEPPLTTVELTRIRKWLAAGAPSLQPHASTKKEWTQHDVLPIVLLRCVTCHGPQRQEGDLDMRTPASMRKGGKSGPALVAGDPDASLMIQRIKSEACPPHKSLLKFFVRRPPTSEVKTLRNWIAAGAPEGHVTPDIPTTEADPLVSDEDRRHWAFQPPKRPSSARAVDDFIVKKLQDRGLTLSSEASRDTLIRRAYLDLVGLPPDIEEWDRWHSSRDPNWYRLMIDHLLASPHYGQRWGRYWLDVAGYADSEGGISADPLREVAWKYRDYVIRSFNDDKPYDRFLREQVAGDELVDYENAPVITQEIMDNLVATGFLRMGIDQTGSRTMNFVPERLGVIDDALNVLCSGVLGITMQCARCHSHKYDPIPQRDYYRFKAVFQGAYDEHDWLSFKTRTLEVALPGQRERIDTVNPQLEREMKALESQLKKAVANVQRETLRNHYPDQSASDREETIAALKIADNNRTLPQRRLVEKLQHAELLPESKQPQPVLAARQEVTRIEQRIGQLRHQLVPPLAIRALWDQGRPSPTYILRGGEHTNAGDLVGPAVPSVLTDGRTPFVVNPPFPNGTPKTGRRLALARWLTQPDHPLTARVLVNRVWYHHFGTGLVATLDNFGVQGEPPSHPELLDWLAITFIERGWSIKELHRLIMNSRVYRQSSRITEERLQGDPANRLLSRMPLRRMNAEALRDSLLFVSGQLDDTPGGPPDAVTVDHEGLVSVNPTADGRWRRSIYLQYRRTEIPTMMDTFDYPEMGPNCLTRSVSTVSPQSLMLMNNEHIRDLAKALAARVDQLVDDQSTVDDFGTKIDTVYALALSRQPSGEERHLGISTLQTLDAAWQGKPLAALETYCHTILNSAAFLYID